MKCGTLETHVSGFIRAVVESGVRSLVLDLAILSLRTFENHHDDQVPCHSAERGMWAAAAVTVAAAAVVCAVAFTRTGRCLLEVVLFRCVHYLPRREVLNTSRSTVRHHPVGGRGVGDDDDSVAQDGGAGGAYSKQAAGNVRDAALAVHAKFVDANGSVDYEGLSMSAELDKLILAAAALERCDLTALTPVELKCCMLNVYNALYMHAAIALRPAGMIQKLWCVAPALGSVVAYPSCTARLTSTPSTCAVAPCRRAMPQAVPKRVVRHRRPCPVTG